MPNLEQYTDILSEQGFDGSRTWLTYAISTGFKRVQSVAFDRCPDCAGQSLTRLGQFVYYSTLCQLLECHTCSLVFTDRHLSPDIVQRHFETAYKDEQYFTERRRAIFQQMIDLVSRSARHGARVLDLGGAKGHLLAGLREKRPDLHLTLNDLSTDACQYAAETYQLRTVQGGVDAVERLGMQFDVIILSDVLYYLPDLAGFWRVLPTLLTPTGTVVIRVPHKLPYIKLQRRLRYRVGPMQAVIPLYNPEHLYALSPKYLTARLKSLGFSRVTVKPSAWLDQSRLSIGLAVSRALAFVTGGQFIATPSLILVGSKEVSHGR